MKKRLLNFSKNLIITLVLVVISIIVFFTTSSYAATSDTFGKLMRTNIGQWYRFIQKLSLVIFSIGYLAIIMKLFFNRTPESSKTIKESILKFLIAFALIYFLHYLMIAVITFNEQGVNLAKDMGNWLSGIDTSTDEYDLYETALSKAYELSAVQGFIGLIMYFLLVFYTYKFVIVYAKRYINVIVLMILAPIIFVISATKDILTGINDGRIAKWFKEFIFNVIIQTVHAIFYATLIGFSLKISDNNDNVVGVLLALIIFSFIFSIDSIIRKIFNFVGGSTKISSSKLATSLVNGAGGVVNTTLNAVDKKSARFGKDMKTGGLELALKNLSFGINRDLSNSINKIPVKFKKIQNLAKETALDAKNKVLEMGQDVKDDIQDIDSILNGDRVKQNLTPDDIVKQYHIMQDAKGLEGVRQNVQSYINDFSKNKKKIGKYTKTYLNSILAKVDQKTKNKIKEIENDYYYMVDDVENNLEMIKSIPKVVNSFNKYIANIKKQKYIKKQNGLNLEITNMMMLAVDVDSELELKEILEELKELYGDNVDATAFVFEKIGVQTFLTPKLGATKIGMATLAEENYEQNAEQRIDEAITGKKRKKKKLKKATIRTSKRAINKATKTIMKNKKINRVYKFSRFNPNTARKITNIMLKKSRMKNRYLITLNKTYEDIQINNLKPRGRISKKSNITNITHTIRATRKDFARSIRRISLNQKVALTNYKEFKQRAGRICAAYDIANRAMIAANSIRLGFSKIDNMTDGQIALRKMIKTGEAYQLSNDFIIMKKENPKEIIKATGIVVRRFPIQDITANNSDVKVANARIKTNNAIEDNIILQSNDSYVEIPQKNQNHEFVATVKKYIATSKESVSVNEKIDSTNNEFVTFKEQNISTNNETVITSEKYNNINTNEEEYVNNDNQTIEEKAESLETVIQFVIAPTGVLKRQVVSTNGNIIEPAVDDDGKILSNRNVEGETEDNSVIVQHIVNLEGNIIKQVINNDNTIRTEEYSIIDKGGDVLVEQINEAITDDDLGLTEDTTLEERVEKFQELLQDIKTQPLLEQILDESTDEEKEMDTIILKTAMDNNVSDLKQLDYEADDEHRKTAIETMVSTGILTSVEAEDEDVVGNALNILNSRVKTLSEDDTARLIDKAAEMEYVRIVEEAIGKGEFSNNTINVEGYLEERENELSELIVGMAKNMTDVPMQVIDSTIQSTVEGITTALDVWETAEQNSEEMEAQKAFKEELQKAEKRWAKKHGQSENADISQKIRKQEEKEEKGKVTLQFFGAVKNQGQSITLSNRNSIKEFYDKVDKLDDADLDKTQERFLQIYSDKIKEMQIPDFSFAKYPLLEMDQWSIYVVSSKEDVKKGDKDKEEEEKIESIPEDIENLLDKYFSDIRMIFVKFVEEYEINSFDDLHDTSNFPEFTRRIRIMLFRKGEEDNSNKAKNIAGSIHKDIKFKNILKEMVKDKIAKKFAEEKVKKAEERMQLKRKQEAEREADSSVTKEKVEKIKSEEKDNLARQIFDEIIKEENMEAQASEDVNRLLKELEENKAYIEVGSKETKDQRRFQY